MGTILLVVVSSFLCAAVFIVWKWGHHLRRWSKFAQTLAQAAADQDAAVSSNRGEGGDSDDGDSPGTDLSNMNHMNRMVHFLSSENLPGSRSHSLPTSAANTPTASRRSSLHLQRPELPARQDSHLSQRSQLMHRAPVDHMPVVPEARSRANSSAKGCSCGGGQTLAQDTCTHGGSRVGESAAALTSLREVENAQPSGVPEEPSAAEEAPLPEMNGENQGNEKGQRGSRCIVM